jgi:FkbM family methyltransferase
MRRTAARIKLELLTRRRSPPEYAKARYRNALLKAANTAVRYEFPGGRLTGDGEFYLDVRGLMIYYNVRHPGWTPGDGQSLEVPSGRQSTPLEQFILGAVADDGVYVDIGANNGFFYALQVAQSHHYAMVFAFEPDPQILPHLERNVRCNGFEGRIEIIRSAVSDRSGTARLTAGLGASGYLLEPVAAEPGIGVACTTLDEFVQQRAISRVDLVKVDIEGHEERMLAGSRRTLLELRPLLVLELAPELLSRSGGSRNGVVRLLTEVRYSLYDVKFSNDAIAFPREREPSDLPQWLSPAGVT